MTINVKEETRLRSSILFDLPEQLHHCLCREWIDTVDLVKLDIAVTVSNQYRPILRALLKDPNFCTYGFAEYLEPDTLQWLTTRNICVQNLSLPDSSFLSWFNSIDINFHHLFCLKIDNLSVANHPNIFDVMFSLPVLQELSLKCCYNFEDLLVDYNINNNNSADIPSCLISQSIIKIDLQGSSSLSEQHMIHLIKRLPKLQWVGLSNCSSFNQLVADHLIIYCPHIHSITLSYLDGLTDSIFANVLQNYSRLQFLDVSHCCNISDSSVIDISHQSEVKGLKLSGNKSISDNCIREVVHTLNGIEVLDLSELPVSNSTFFHIAPSCCNMRELLLDNCLNLDDVSLIRIAECAGETLERIDLTYCYKITDAGIISLAKCCKRLRDVNLAFCLLVTDFGIENVAKNCTELTTLILAGMNQLTDGCLIILAEDLPLIEELNISGCTLITDTSLIGLLLACQHLRRLDISDNHLISDLSIQRLMQLPSCHHMRFLNLSYCVNIDEYSVLQLRNAFPKLFVHYSRASTNYFDFHEENG